MDYENVSAVKFGHALSGISVNLLVRNVAVEVTFLKKVFNMEVFQAGRDFAIVLHAGKPFQLHSDASFSSHPLYGVLPESGPRGAGIELRLHEADPDVAAALVADFPDAMLLQVPTNKAAHGLREAVILCPNGYAWVPSRRI